MTTTRIEIGRYTIDPVLLEKGLAAGCGPFRCRANCCAKGVLIDPAERDFILEHRDEVQAMMDDTQTRDDAAWFETVILEDVDFPSGHAVGTEVHNGKCVFLDRDRRCTLQLLGVKKYNDPWKIKPYYCIAFPIYVDKGLVTFDDSQQGKSECCSIVPDAGIPLIDSCKAELEHVLGNEGYRQLQKHATSKTHETQPLSVPKPYLP